MQELWLFGQLKTLDKNDIQGRIDEDAKEVAEMLAVLVGGEQTDNAMKVEGWVERDNVIFLEQFSLEEEASEIICIKYSDGLSLAIDYCLSGKNIYPQPKKVFNVILPV